VDIQDAQDIQNEQLESRGGHNYNDRICGVCDGALLYLGCIGGAHTYRCRHCGLTATRKPDSLADVIGEALLRCESRSLDDHDDRHAVLVELLRSIEASGVLD
jgi:hypothetical protein